MAFNSWRSQTVGRCTLSLERGDSFHAYEGVRSGIGRMKAKGGFVSETLQGRSEMYREWETRRSDGRRECILAEAFLVRKRREREAVETRRGSPMGTGEEWQKQSLGRGRSWESARGCSASTQREGEQKGAQGDMAARCKPGSSPLHPVGMQALGSDHRSRHNQDKPDPQKRLIQYHVDREPRLIPNAKVMPTPRPAGSCSSRP